jgi:hypothetical protein
MGNESNQQSMKDNNGIQYLIQFLSSDSGEPQPVCLKVTDLPNEANTDLNLSTDKYLGFIFE